MAGADPGGGAGVEGEEGSGAEEGGGAGEGFRLSFTFFFFLSFFRVWGIGGKKLFAVWGEERGGVCVGEEFSVWLRDCLGATTLPT